MDIENVWNVTEALKNYKLKRVSLPIDIELRLFPGTPY